MRVFVILPAAGMGTRMAPGHATPNAPKQFLALQGLPILVHSLRAFAAVPRVDSIYVAVRKPEMGRMEALIAEHALASRVRVAGPVEDLLKAFGPRRRPMSRAQHADD